MTDLIAPEHLRGRMPRSKPEALRSERISWAAKVSREGRLNIEIAAALGITEHSVGAILKHVGGCQRPRAAVSSASLYSQGLRFGSGVAAIYDALPDAIRESLASEAARGDGNISSVIIKRLTEGHA